MKSKALKQTEAAERKAKYDRLTTVEKLSLIATRRGNSDRETARVMREAVK
jgi:hypothetical protein